MKNNRTIGLMSLLCCGIMISSCSTVSYRGKLEQGENTKTHELADIYYCLPVAKLLFTAKKPAKQGDNWEYTIESKIYPDTRTVQGVDGYYGLKISHNGFAHDTIEFKTENGLLKSINSTNEDRTGEILVKVVDVATNVLKAAFGMPELGASATPTAKPFKFEFKPTNDGLERINEVLKKNLHTDVTVDIPDEQRIEYEPIEMARTRRTRVNTIYYKPVHALDVSINGKNGPEDIIISQQTILVPANTVFAVDLSRAAFVKKQTVMSFDKGMLTSIKIDQPSQVEGFVDTVLSPLEKIVSLPGSVLTFEVNNINQQTSRIEAEKKLRDAIESVQ